MKGPNKLALMGGTLPSFCKGESACFSRYGPPSRFGSPLHFAMRIVKTSSHVPGHRGPEGVMRGIFIQILDLDQPNPHSRSQTPSGGKISAVLPKISWARDYYPPIINPAPHHAPGSGAPASRSEIICYFNGLRE